MSHQVKKVKLETIKVHPFEKWIINKWREKYRYGEFTVIMQDGLPVRIKKAITVEAPPSL